MLSKVKLGVESSKLYEFIHGNELDNIIDNLSRINIFIGSNNSGKSRLIRDIFSKTDYLVQIKDNDITYLNKKLNEAIEDLENMYKNSPIASFSKFKTELSKLNIDPGFFIKNKFENFDMKKIDAVYGHYREEINSTYRNNVHELTHLRQVGTQFWNKHFDEIKKRIIQVESNQISRFYIPTLRSLKDIFRDGSETVIYRDIFNEITDRHYFDIRSDKENRHVVVKNIFTGLTFYNEVKHESHHDYENKQRLVDFLKFLSESFFNNANTDITPHNDGVTRIIIDGEERRVEDLGDGIQSIIILTYQLFKNQGKDAIFFFEEPETHLHPGYQRLFIETLRRPEFNTFQYFMSTHSNHFLDLTLEHDDMSIYTFTKQKQEDNTFKFLVENVAHGDDNILQLIGANKSSVFLSNCTLWVEGITDRIYLRKYLDLHQEHLKETSGNVKLYKEDTHYSFVEYGGGNITHWSFLDSEDEKHNNINIKRLCAKAFVVTDSDNSGNNLNGSPSKKKLRQEKLKATLGDKQYYCLQAREIENLLTKSVIEAIVKSHEADETVLNFTALKDKDIVTKSLGKLIEEKVKGLDKKKSYAKSSGTINDKVGFAKKAVEYMNNYDDMSEEAKELAEKLYEFIKSQNE